MIVTKGIEIRLYPTKGQANFINKMIGASRVVYNSLLYKKHNYYKETGETLYIKITDLYKEYPWLKGLDSSALSSVSKDLNTAYSNFFANRAKFPKYKKKSKYGSYRNSRPSNSFFRGNNVSLPKLKLVKYSGKVNIENIIKIHNISIKRAKSGKYYCSICCDYNQYEFCNTCKVIGVDLGIKDLVIDSNGNKYSNPKCIQKAEKKIKHLQRLYSKKMKGSKNQEKARLKLAIAHEKLSNKRKDNLHKITTKLIKENDIICIENLNVKGMMKNHHLAKAIQDASFGTLVRMLKYKAAWHGRQIVEIGSFYPSSKLCSCCGHKMDSMPLSVRQWTCPNCGTQHDRDINAAVNIKNEGLRILDNQYTEESTGIKACGVYDHFSYFSNMYTLKQEGKIKS